METTKLNIVHISDLHYDHENNEQIKILDCLFSDIESFRSENELRIDLVLFTGDLTAKGHYYEDLSKHIIDNFVNPLISAASINIDRLHICPGNHDIDIKLTDRYGYKGIRSAIQEGNADTVATDFASGSCHTKHVQPFYSLLQDVGVLKDLPSNLLWTSSSFDVEGKKIGIANLNSAWLCTGKQDNHDYGKLILGELQLRKCIDSIKDGDIKLLMLHHPLDWLDPNENGKIKGLILGDVDILLHGHNHKTSTQQAQHLQGELTISNAGCLYQTSKFEICYNILSIDLISNNCDVYIREYSHERKCFHESIKYSENGKFSFVKGNLNNNTSQLVKPGQVVSIQAHLVKTTGGLMIGEESMSDSKCRLLYQEPVITDSLASTPTAKKSTDKQKIYSLNSLVNDTKNYLVYGEKESGKTTLINELAFRISEFYVDNATNIPVIMDCNSTTYLSGDYTGEICKNSGNIFSKTRTKKILESGKCTVLIDNFHPASTDQVKSLVAFIEEYDKCRYIVVAIKDKNAELGLQDNNFNKIGFLSISLKPFTRREVKGMIEKRLPENDKANSLLADKIIEQLTRAQMPRTPLIISMMLWMHQQRVDIFKANRAVLVENFLQIILGKSVGLRLEEMDYIITEDFLLELALTISKHDSKLMPHYKLERFAVKYFESKGFKESAFSYIEKLIGSSVLIQSGSHVSFKLDCFREYFLAKKFLKDPELLESEAIMLGYLHFSHEIDYLTGLDRKQVGLLKTIKELLKEKLKNLPVSDHNKINTYMRDGFHQLNEPSSEQGNVNDKGEVLEEIEPIEKDVKEEFLNEIDSHMAEFPIPNMSEIEKLNSHSPEDSKRFDNLKEILQTLILYSNIVKNCELIDDVEIKGVFFEFAFKSWCDLAYCAIHRAVVESTLLDEGENEDKSDQLDRNQLEKIMVLTSLHALSASFSFELVTSKLEIFVRKAYENSTEFIQMYLAAFAFAEIRGEGWLDIFEDLVEKSAKATVMKEVLSSTFMHYNNFKYLTKFEHERLLKLTLKIQKSMVRPARNQGVDVSSFMKTLKEMRNKNFGTDL